MIDIGSEYFITTSKIESKRPNNLIVLKIKDFSQFAQNIVAIDDTATVVNLFLAREGEGRYIKIKWMKDDAIVTITKTEISLFFDDIEFPNIESRLFSLIIERWDLKELLEICNKRETNLKLKFRVSNNNTGQIILQVSNPKVKIQYDQVQVKDLSDQIGDVFQYQFVIDPIHAKQLINITAIEEYYSICLLKDRSLCIECWETNEDNFIIALKTFIVPRLDEMDEKMEEEKSLNVQTKEEDNEQSSQNKNARQNNFNIEDGEDELQIEQNKQLLAE